MIDYELVRIDDTVAFTAQQIIDIGILTKKASGFSVSIQYEEGYIMVLPTDAIENELIAFLSTAYSDLVQEYIFFTVAMLISCAVIPIFIVWMFNKSDRKHAKAGCPYKAYTYKKTTPLGIHTVVKFMMPVLAVRKMYCCLRPTESTYLYGVKLIVFCGLLILLAILAMVGLSKFRIFGLFSTGAFVFCFAALEQYQNLLAITADMRNRTQFETISQYTVYIVDDYIMTQSMAFSFAALITLILLAIYYYKRRFLFMPGKLSLPSCKNCGQVISKGDDFCTCCGKRLLINPIKQVIIPLDQKPFCERCGSFTNKSVCIKCNKKMSDYVKKTTKEKLDKMKTSLLRGLILGTVILVLFLLNLDGLMSDIESGSARVNNAFVERWNEFDNDLNLASDSEWLAGFDSVAEALYQMDARWRSVNPRSVQSDCLAYFMVYTNASFQQMKALEQSVENVHKAAQGELTAVEIRTELTWLQYEYNKTLQMQASATNYYGSVSAQWDILGKIAYICFDGLRTLLPQVNIVLVSIVCMAGCTLVLMYMLNGFSNTATTKLEQWLQNTTNRADIRNEKYSPARFVATPMTLLRRTAATGKDCWLYLIRAASELWLLIVHLICMVGLLFSLFSSQNIGRCIHWLKAGLTDVKGVRANPSAAHKHNQRCTSLVAAIIVVMIFGVCALCVNRFSLLTYESSDNQEYLFAAKAATNDYTVDISKILIDVCNAKNLTQKNKELLYDLIQAQVEADQVILAYDMTGLDDYQALHAGLQSLCRDDIETLQRIKATIEDGLVPSQELQRNYYGLRGENYLWVINEVAQEFVIHAVKTAFDL